MLDVHEGTVIESRNAAFFEDVFSCKGWEASSQKWNYDIVIEIHQENEEPRHNNGQKYLWHLAQIF